MEPRQIKLRLQPDGVLLAVASSRRRYCRAIARPLWQWSSPVGQRWSDRRMTTRPARCRRNLRRRAVGYRHTELMSRRVHEAAGEQIRRAEDGVGPIGAGKHALRQHLARLIACRSVALDEPQGPSFAAAATKPRSRPIRLGVPASELAKARCGIRREQMRWRSCRRIHNRRD
jgi:hypothetical protein